MPLSFDHASSQKANRLGSRVDRLAAGVKRRFAFGHAICGAAMLRLRARGTSGHIEPCLSSPAERPPFGNGWIYEIKHDGFRIMARRDGAGVRLITRNSHDFTSRFPLAAAAVAALPARSFLLDGEAIVTDDSGVAVFDLVRRKRYGDAAVLVAFDLVELDGRDLRREPIEQREHMLTKLVRGPRPGIVVNEH